MPDTSPYDWFRPRLKAMMQEATEAGIAPDVAIAIVTDLINGPDFNSAPPPVDEEWNKDIGEPDHAPSVEPRDEVVPQAVSPSAGNWPDEILNRF